MVGTASSKSLKLMRMKILDNMGELIDISFYFHLSPDILCEISCTLLQWVTFNVAKNISGQLVYEGMIVEIVKALADTLNFRWVETGMSTSRDGLNEITLILLAWINNHRLLFSVCYNYSTNPHLQSALDVNAWMGNYNPQNICDITIFYTPTPVKEWPIL